MVIGIGTDIIEINRIEKAICKTHRFLNKILTIEEYNCYINKGQKAEYVAGVFSAKEAISKALGTGFRTFTFQDINILKNELDKPYVKLNGNASNIFNNLGANNILVSISHCKEYAVAMAIIEM